MYSQSLASLRDLIQHTLRVIPEGGVLRLLVAADVVPEVGLGEDVVRISGGCAEAGLGAAPVITTLGG